MRSSVPIELRRCAFAEPGVTATLTFADARIRDAALAELRGADGPA